MSAQEGFPPVYLLILLYIMPEKITTGICKIAPHTWILRTEYKTSFVPNGRDFFNWYDVPYPAIDTLFLKKKCRQSEESVV